MATASLRCITLARWSRGLASVVIGGLVIAVSMRSEAGVADADEFRLLVLDGVALKWGVPHAATPARVSWAVQTALRFDDTAINCRFTKGFEELRGASKLGFTAMNEEINSAFALWEAVTGISFVQTSDESAADILVGAQVEARGIAWTNVSYKRDAVYAGQVLSQKDRKPVSIGRLTKAHICLNPLQSWRVGFDGDPGTFDLRYVIAHEIGHAIGLDHPGKSGQLMGFSYQELNGPMAGDVRGANLLYGPPLFQRHGSSETFAAFE